jgi:hypothetical protein
MEEIFKMIKRHTSLTGATGEHFVAYKLSALNYPVALTRGGSPTIDLMVGDLRGGAAISIQVKTSSYAWRKRVRKPEDSHWEWDVGRKALSLRGNNIFYAFVDLNEDDQNDPPVTPDIFIVPSNDVADQAIKAGFEEHPDWNKFMFWIYEKEKSKYKDAWKSITSMLDG